MVRSIEIEGLKESIDEKMSIPPLETPLQLMRPESGNMTAERNTESLFYSHPSLPLSVRERMALDIIGIQWQA